MGVLDTLFDVNVCNTDAVRRLTAQFEELGISENAQFIILEALKDSQKEAFAIGASVMLNLIIEAGKI